MAGGFSVGILVQIRFLNKDNPKVKKSVAMGSLMASKGSVNVGKIPD